VKFATKPTLARKMLERLLADTAGTVVTAQQWSAEVSGACHGNPPGPLTSWHWSLGRELSSDEHRQLFYGGDVPRVIEFNRRIFSVDRDILITVE
jgi:hypothetical protein